MVIRKEIDPNITEIIDVKTGGYGGYIYLITKHSTPEDHVRLYILEHHTYNQVYYKDFPVESHVQLYTSHNSNGVVVVENNKEVSVIMPRKMRGPSSPYLHVSYELLMEQNGHDLSPKHPLFTEIHTKLTHVKSVDFNLHYHRHHKHHLGRGTIALYGQINALSEQGRRVNTDHTELWDLVLTRDELRLQEEAFHEGISIKKDTYLFEERTLVMGRSFVRIILDEDPNAQYDFFDYDE